MGYETEVFLVEGRQIFGKWESRSNYWYTKNLPKGDNPNIDELPDDAQFSDGGAIVAALKLSKLGYDYEEGTLPWLFKRDREHQKSEKKYVLLEWRMKDSGDDEDPIVTDPYGDPYVVHDAAETLKALRRSMELDQQREGWVYRRFAMLEPMLEQFIQRFGEGVAVISRGY